MSVTLSLSLLLSSPGMIKAAFFCFVRFWKHIRGCVFLPVNKIHQKPDRAEKETWREREREMRYNERINKLTERMTLSLPWVRQWKAQKQPSEARFCTVLRKREHERERCWLDSLFSLLIMSFSIYDWQIKCLLMKWGRGGEEGQKGRGEAEIDFCGQRRRKAVHEIHYIPKQWAQEKKSFSFCTDNKPASRWMETSISHTGMINHTQM